MPPNHPFSFAANFKDPFSNGLISLRGNAKLWMIAVNSFLPISILFDWYSNDASPRGKSHLDLWIDE